MEYFLGFLQLRRSGYQFNLPLATHVMAEQQNQKLFVPFLE